MSDQKTQMYKGSQADEGPNGNEDSTSNWAKSHACHTMGWEGAFCPLSGTLTKTKLEHK